MSEEKTVIDLTKLKWDENKLIPAIVQDVHSKAVLMLAYMSEESLQETIDMGTTCFYSRSRQELWRKGETSGHFQKVCEIKYDCDADTLLLTVEQTGSACHEGSFSCFTNVLWEKKGNLPVVRKESIAEIIGRLYEIIVDRKENGDDKSYTKYLFVSGQDKILKKVGEEAAETIIASKNNDNGEVVYEMADLWYHCIVLLAYHGISPDNLLGELASRRK